MNQKNKRKLGTEYEQMVARYLEEKGYIILEHSYRNRFGEIDLIARIGQMLVFVEVKYRSTYACGNPLEAVDIRKQRQISRTAMHYYAKHGYVLELPCRFDVIGIDHEQNIIHIENAFDYIW